MSPSSPSVQSGPVELNQPGTVFFDEPTRIANGISLVKSLRRDIDQTIQVVKSMDESPQRSIVVTKLTEAVMWLGMDLKRINEENPGASPNPYPNSKDPSNTKIEPTADGLKL